MQSQIGSASPVHIPSLKDCRHNQTKCENKHNLKISILELFSELEEIWEYIQPKLTFKNLNNPYLSLIEKN